MEGRRSWELAKVYVTPVTASTQSGEPQGPENTDWSQAVQIQN